MLNICTKFERLLPAQPCVLCAGMSRHGLCCKACDAALPYLDAAHCPICALPTPQGEICGHCLRKPPSFNRTLAVFGYRFPLDRLIRAMKYEEQLALSQLFSGKLIQLISPDRLPDYVIAMPLHPDKLKRRGFNQALLIAARLARSFERPLLTQACQRLRDTPSQSSLSWKARKKNVRGAFRCDMDLSGKHVALVDDVLTTGASLNALADAVQKRGAAEISAWVVARTLPHDHS
ncbi:MAG: ComF family protein [Gallionella sp.]|nr:ComF family protein [Gallionella sp.]